MTTTNTRETATPVDALPGHSRAAHGDVLRELGALWPTSHSMRDWVDDLARIQDATLAYAQRRFERELDAVAHVLSCRDATELLDLQVHRASEVLADSVALWLRLTALVNGSARRRYRRAAARRQGRPAAS